MALTSEAPESSEASDAHLTAPGEHAPDTSDVADARGDDSDVPCGKVFFVGAGPGNPDLVTVRAREIMGDTAHAVVDEDVLHGVRAMVGVNVPVPEEKVEAARKAYEELVAQAKESGARRRPPRPEPPTAAELMESSAVFTSVTSSVTSPSVAEATEGEEETPTVPGIAGAAGAEGAAAMAEVLAARARKGDNVVRLVAGNPLSREAVLTEINAVGESGVEFQVVPGMSLPSTVPAFAGVALGSTFTEADVTTTDVDWDQLVAAPQPLVLQAVKANLPTIATELTARGLPDDTPVSVTTHGTTRLQRTYDATVSTMGAIDAELSGSLVVTVGHAVDTRVKYSWWESRPLYGWRVLVPRAKSQAAEMSARLATHGAIPQEVPTISLEPPRNPAQMERAIKGIVEGRYQWVLFTSVNAVDAVWNKITEFGLDARAFAGVRLGAVGHKTAKAIRALGLTPEIQPDPHEQNARGMVKVFPPYVEDLDPVGRVLLPRADLGTDVLVDGLTELGWEVDDVVAYRTVRAAPPAAETRDMIKTGGFDAVCFTSSSTVKNLVGIAGKPHQRTIIAAIGPMTAETAKEMGLRVDVMPEVADVNGLVDALAEHVAQLRATGQLPPPRKKRRSRKQSS